jgi:hypothetical protein
MHFAFLHTQRSRTPLTPRAAQEWQRFFQARQAQIGAVHKLRPADILWARAIPVGFAFAASIELVRGMRDLLTGQNKKPGF